VARTEAKKSKTTLVALIVAAFVAAAAAAYAVVGGGPGMATAPVEVAWNGNAQMLVSLAAGATEGDPKAQIAIMEFADYSCPHCREFDQTVRPRIQLTYLLGGKVKFVYHDFVLGSFPHSFLAARAARCAGDQQKYFEYHDVLFRDQPLWSTSRTAPVAQLLDYAEEVGLDAASFEACLKSDKHADVVSANTELAVQLNLGRTPSVLVRANPTSLPVLVDDADKWNGIVKMVDSILGTAAPDTTKAPAPPRP
jgi:protein-disulfide isomerase